MRDNQMNGTYERRRAFVYGADGHKAVRRWYWVQNIVGPLYITKGRKNSWGELEADLFIFFPNVDIGLPYHHITFSNCRSVEDFMESLKWDCVDNELNFVGNLDKQMAQNMSIGNVEIAFVRQFDPSRADKYAKFNDSCNARKEEQESAKKQEQEAQRKAEEDAEKARQQAELASAKAKYFGWADSMSPIRFSRVQAKMEGFVRKGCEILQLRDLIISLIKDGWVPKKEEGATTCCRSKRNLEESKPKTVHKLSKGNACYKVNKTEFDFAVYLAEHKELLFNS